MGVRLADDEEAAPVVIVLAGAEALHEARRHALRPQQQHGRRGEVLAVALVAVEEEELHGIGAVGAGRVQRVAEVGRAQVALDRLRLVGRLLEAEALGEDFLVQLGDGTTEVLPGAKGVDEFYVDHLGPAFLG